VLRALLPHQTFSMNWMLYHGREFERLIQNPPLMTLIDASLGRGAVIASLSSIKKGRVPASSRCTPITRTCPNRIPSSQ
jgi:hypothetical protein